MSIPRAARINNSRDFEVVYKYGKSVANRDIVLYYRKSEKGRTRLGLAVSRKIGNAVARNRVKRLLREAFKNNMGRISGGLDVILIARRPIREKSFHDVEKTFIDILSRARLIDKNEDNSGSAY